MSEHEPAIPYEDYCEVAVCRRRFQFKTPTISYPVWVSVLFQPKAAPGNRVYQVSDFAGSQDQAARLAEKIAFCLRYKTPPPFPDDGGEPLRKGFEKYREDLKRRREKRKERDQAAGANLTPPHH